MVRYQFLVDTYETEMIKVVSVWSMAEDQDLLKRPGGRDTRGRNFLEHMVHQCLSEDFWFRTMLSIQVTNNPLPGVETRQEFIQCYAAHAGKRLDQLRQKSNAWWDEEVDFFEVRRARTWVVVRRIAHTAHHRGQQTALLRMLGRDLHSTYGPTADTGGLMQNKAPVIYAYPDLGSLITEEFGDRRKSRLPDRGGLPLTERASSGAKS